jgi:hypothetical protein
MERVYSRVPKGYHPFRYQTKAYDECTISRRIFKQDQQAFLKRYMFLHPFSDFFKPGDLFSVMKDAETMKEAEKKITKLRAWR